MKYDRMDPAAAREGDKPVFLAAIDKLLLAGVDARRPPKNDHQIKVNSTLSFYPGTGVAYRDGDQAALPFKGVEALIEHLREEGMLAGNPVTF